MISRGPLVHAVWAHDTRFDGVVKEGFLKLLACPVKPGHDRPDGHREGLRVIPIEDIQFFLAEQKYTTVRHVNGEDLIEDSLRSLEEEFGSVFVRIHRNALVSVRYLERIERNAGQYFVRLRGCEAPLQVSRRMAGELRD